MMKTHDLHVGDIVCAVDGVDRDEAANRADLYIKLRKAAGDTVTLDVLRDNQHIKMPLKTYRMYFRK
jgi:C-terminal processing protease CtpA/Prc